MRKELHNKAASDVSDFLVHLLLVGSLLEQNNIRLRSDDERDVQHSYQMILVILGNHIPAGTCMRSFERGRKLIAAQVVETSC